MLPLEAAVRVLQDAGIKYCIAETKPCSKQFALLGDCRYVLRQTLHEGKVQLVIAAKMGKEV